ncbi:single-stranded DNA-binding protein [Synechococcus elongatus PCC 6301]|nr:single-stranded DNA-binding protein [Synechococcus elongatus PCC 6301]
MGLSNAQGFDCTMSLNVVNLVGRVGRDPEARYFESGSVVCKFSLAVNRRSRNDEPDWFNVEMWGREAQVAIDYVKKGSLIGISGALKIESWTDRNNNQRTTPVVRANRLELLGSRRDQEGGMAPRDPDSDLF